MLWSYSVKKFVMGESKVVDYIVEVNSYTAAEAEEKGKEKKTNFNLAVINSKPSS